MRNVDPGLPGAGLVAEGLRDLAAGTATIAALVVAVGRPRLRELGFDVPRTVPDPELELYRRLAVEHGDEAHSRYNALIRTLVSFERAAERAN